MRRRTGQAAVIGAEHRGTRRRVVSLAAHAREADLQLHDVEVVDLCSEGCRIRGDIDFEQATCVWLRIPGVTPRRARIAWSKAGEAGCTFEEPICEEALDQALLARFPSKGGPLRLFQPRAFGTAP